ncbi:MAG TPA: CRTAC1 family protein [Vicinamibacterales bacterium]|nr:CRTAC1 family protein [Vicinamibacterales bacterium]
MIGRRLGVLTLALAAGPVLVLTGRAGRAQDPLFDDVTARAGITFVHQSGATPDKYMMETFGSGVAWIDIDNDGFQDLYFVNGAVGASNILYRNNRNGTFSNITESSGTAGSSSKAYKTGVAVGDYDNDGLLDLFVTAYGPDILYRNLGNGKFADVTAAAGVAGGAAEWGTSAGFFDYDRDGDLDLYVANYVDFRMDENPWCGDRKPGYRMYCNPTIFDGTASRLYRNNGNGTFTDVSKAAGIANPAGKGLGVVFCDYDRDGDSDIYVANDLVRNFLYRNNGDGTFQDVAYAASVGFDINGKPQAGMGVDCGDVDGDGLPELFVTNFSEELNILYKNHGDGTFQDVTQQIGLGSGFLPLGFGTKMYDYDNDGDLDIHVTNGHVIDNVKLYTPALSYEQKDLLYENTGGKFKDVSALAGGALQNTRVGRGLAVADFDNDGFLDVAISSLGRRGVLLRNRGVSKNNWIEIRAEGTTSNRFGLGATVRLQAPGGLQVREINNAASYQSANDIRLHVGLGAAKTIPQIEILWPSGIRQTLKDVAVNQILTVKEAGER